MQIATAKPTRTRQPSRWLRALILWGVVAAVALLGWVWQPLRENAVTAAAYGARVACPCRFIAGRDLSDCRDDFEPGMGPAKAFVMLSEDVETRSVTARVPFLISQTATFREGQGCQLEPWE